MSAEPIATVLQMSAKPTASFVAVTPELAERWLKLNSRNRKIRKTDVDRYKRDMRGGKWHLDGSPIRFSPDGYLLDGQHRLTAIAETGVTIPMLVVRGVDSEAQSVMDTGRRRSAADALDIAGHAHYSTLAAAARLLLEVDNGWLDMGGRYEVSHSEILATIEANPDLESAVAFIRPLTRKSEVPPVMAAYTYMIMRRISAQDAAEFWVAMSEKVGLKAGDPVLALSNRFAEARRSRERLKRSIQLSLIYRAWNARRHGKTMTFIRVNSPKGGLVAIPKPI